MNKKCHDKPESKDKRKSLRNNLTSAEAFLWSHLSSKQLKGRKFRRQHGINNYIVDFYCASENLVIELDGEVHMNATAKEYDSKRTKHLESLSLNVLRFENKMVFENLKSVLMEIEAHFDS